MEAERERKREKRRVGLLAKRQYTATEQAPPARQTCLMDRIIVLAAGGRPVLRRAAT